MDNAKYSFQEKLNKVKVNYRWSDQGQDVYGTDDWIIEYENRENPNKKCTIRVPFELFNPASFVGFKKILDDVFKKATLRVANLMLHGNAKIENGEFCYRERYYDEDDNE